ncbi:MAG: B12-binding domain-containing radical SAM protein [Gemmataceae bacterium]
MELPSRPKNDRYTRPGQYRELEHQLRKNTDHAEIPCLVAYAFDMRTRLGPFLFADMRLLTAGPRAVASALHAAGYTRTRVVLTQWNTNFQPSAARIDGRLPQMLFVSSMQIHSARAYEMIADAHKLGDDRPLIMAGGAKAIYEPWDFFGLGPNRDISADVACTGEEFVILELLARMDELKQPGEHPRATFHRLRRAGLLDDIPGLVFRAGDERDPLTNLVDTGIQRMVQDLDEVPHPLVGMGLIEPPHQRRGLSRRPLDLKRLRKYAGMVSVVTTHGCKFHCSYCPIPAYNQFTFRWKSPQRLRQELEDVGNATGIQKYFGTDDNFFNNRETVDEVFTEMAKGRMLGKPFRDSMFFGTEATEFDVFKNKDLLPVCREGGLRAIWFGIEDMTAELVKKGQSPEKTKALFTTLNEHGICPMAMMMHHDGQPLYSKGQLYGIVNQVNFLRKTGAVSAQITILTPSVGSKGYYEPYQQGLVIDEANGQKVDDHLYDGNHCIATNDPNPWRKQMNIFLSYASFYNPLNFARAFFNFRDPVWKVRVMYQAIGMIGMVKSIRRGFGWMKNLYLGPVRKKTEVPQKALPVVAVKTQTA